MRDLPQGTVTFLFTDIEGSTRLLEELGDGYGDALTAHRAALRAAFGAHSGVEVDNQGDAFFFVFPDAREAVAAAAAGQEALTTGPVRVRMGLHTGEPSRTDEGYFGRDVNIGARVAASAHGGQVVLTKATHDLLDGEAVTDLGEHRVKDIDQAIWIYQLGDRLFPPLKTISNTSLPRPASTFVGRERELKAVVQLIRGSRLVTLTGPGGSGKTRLAIEAASEVVGELRNGVFWVPLAATRDPDGVLPEIGRTIGAQGDLGGAIGTRELLLVLDNFEQVVSAAPELASLVEACPNLRLLVTSRELLRVRGEVEYEVLPLAQQEAVDLLTQRSGLEPDEDVEELCRRLDNMPLALELAAARTKALTPKQILDRLGRRLDLFRGGRDTEERQATLRATIAWSHQLLAEEEQRVFARLGVFSGGCTLDAAEDIAGAEVETLQSLVEKSLVRHTEGRFWMLETIRAYACEQLAASSDAAEVERRHAEHFLRLAESFGANLEVDQLDVLDAEYANLQGALDCFLDSGDDEQALALAGALREFWFKRGYLTEGRRRLEQTLAAAPERRSAARARALCAAAVVASLQSDFEGSRVWAEEAYRLSMELGRAQLVAWALGPLGRVALADGDPARAVDLYREAEAFGREAGDVETLWMVAFNLGYIALGSGDLELARDELRRSLQVGASDYCAARSYAALGAVELHDGQPEAAIPHLHECLALCTELADRDDGAWALELLGVARAGSDPEAAARLLGAAEAQRDALGNRLEGLELELHLRAVGELGGLDPDRRERAWNAGRRLGFADAVEFALAGRNEPTPSSS